MASLINSDNGVSSGSAGLKSSADSSGVLQLQTNGTAALTVDTSQNVGIGIAPNAWSANLALQMTGPSLWGASGVSHLSTNTYFDGTNYKYIATNYVTDYYQLNGTHVWRYAASGTAGTNVTLNEAMRIDASGNVLVGTASAYANFVIKKADGTQFLVSGTTYGARVRTDASYAYVEGVDYTGSASYQPLQVGGSILSLATGGTERARIDSSGSLLVGTTSNPNSSKLYVTGSTATASSITSAAEFRLGGSGENGGQILLQNTYSGATNTNKWLRVDNSGNLQVVNSAYNAVIFQVTDGGNLTISGATATKASGTTWANPSDQRLKNNIRDYEKGSAELMQIRVREWEYNGKGGTTEGMKGLGVIADEIMTVLPDTVENYEEKLNADDEEKTAIKKFDATEITWLLVKTVQEQNQLIIQLQADVAALKGRT